MESYRGSPKYIIGSASRERARKKRNKAIRKMFVIILAAYGAAQLIMKIFLGLIL